MVKKALFAILLLLVLINLVSVISAQDYQTQSTCTERWVCDDWSSCRDGERVRDCWDENHCGTTLYKPSEERECSYGCYANVYYPRSHRCYQRYVDVDSEDIINTIEYYRNQLNEYRNTQQNNPPYVVNVQYPTTSTSTASSRPLYDTNYKEGMYVSWWLIGAIVLGAIILILLIIIVAFSLRR